MSGEQMAQLFTMKRRRKLTAAELKQLGVSPGLHAIGYPASAERTEVRQPVGEASDRPPFAERTKQTFFKQLLDKGGLNVKTSLGRRLETAG